MKFVFSKKDYRNMLRDSLLRISFPRTLTTDGVSVDLEWHNGTDQFEYSMIPVWYVSCSDNIPSFAEISRMRKLVKSGLRGEALDDAIHDWLE